MKEQGRNANDCDCGVCADVGGDRYVVPTDYLRCRNVWWTLCPPGILEAEDEGCREERAFWMRYEPLAQTWIRSSIQSARVHAPLEAWHGVGVLLSAVFEECGASGSWTKLTGHDILFEHLGNGGLLPGWSARNVILGMVSFLEFLSVLGAIDDAVVTHLLAELGAWRERAIAYLGGGGPWVRADGRLPTPCSFEGAHARGA